MNRTEFMKQLEILLGSISSSEKEEALQYYNDYFNDAGVENEKDVIAALGTPAKVAEIIKSGLSGKSEENYEFTDRGFYNGNEKRNNAVAVRREPYSEEKRTEDEKKNMNPVAIVLIIIGILLLFPLWVPFVGAAFGIVVAILTSVLALVFAFAVAGIAILITGVVLFVLALVKLFVAPIAALCLAGAGMILAGLGILFLIATTWLCGKAVPAIIRGIVYLCRLPFGKKGGQMA